MVRRPLGATGLQVSPIGFGAFKIGRNQGIKYPSGYALPDDAAVRALLDGVLAAGINYVDTAPAYGSSEERIGRHLGSRTDLVVSTKVGEEFEDGRSRYDFSAASVRRSVARSAQRLGREVLDLVFIHAHGDDVAILEQTDVVATLGELKRAGHVRAIGFSGKTVAGARRALDFADVLMVELHLRDRAHEAVVTEAAARGVGVVVKKGLAAGHLPAAEAIAFVLGHPGVASLVIGGLDLAHVRANVALAERAGA